MLGKRKLEELSVEELEKALLLKKRQSRLERFQRQYEAGRSANEALLGDDVSLPTSNLGSSASSVGEAMAASGFQVAVLEPLRRGKLGRQRSSGSDDRPPKSRSKRVVDALLLGLEVVSLFGLVAVLLISYFNLKELNNEVSIAQQSAIERKNFPAPTASPPIALARLPGGHSSPTSQGGAMPDIPPHLQQWVQPSSASLVTTIGVTHTANAPTRIVIPKIKVDAPIVSGVTWEDLKKGVGHLPGSANPGERGNLYLAAHNDIFGEIFRHLEDLKPGDEYFIYASEQKFRYVVKEKRIIAPTAVDVMQPTTEPVATLQTCYPYLVDTHRLVVTGELAE